MRYTLEVNGVVKHTLGIYWGDEIYLEVDGVMRHTLGIYWGDDIYLGS